MLNFFQYPNKSMNYEISKWIALSPALSEA